MLKKTFGLIGLIAVVLLGVLIVRTLAFRSFQGGEEAGVSIALDEEAAAARLAGSLTYPTISFEDQTQIDSGAFRDLHDFLRDSYPLTHGELQPETVAELSLLYTWPGREPNLDPIVLMGHMDVVPVIPGTEDDWEHLPFGGVIADGYVWGRGAMDDKSSVLAILEAVEKLLGEEYQPARTVYLAFGHDEEVGGANGAKQIADLLEARGVNDYALVLDEGGAIVEGLIPGVPGRAAIFGIAEKGGVSLELLVEGEGGHSSMPPEHTNIGILSKAITRLEENQFPASVDGPAFAMFEYIGPEMSFGMRMLFANMWLFKPLVTRGLVANPQTAAMVRTTTAATIIAGGVKSNVLPIDARAVVNFRIIPGETVETVKERVREVIADDRVQISGSGRDPSPVSSTETEAFQVLTRTLRQLVPSDDLIVAPYLVMGGTDARYYAARSDKVYRFFPAMVGDGDLARVHGTGERLAVESFALGVRYFYQLIKNADEL
jgi:carboxypeptidase PM20D1